MMKFGFAAFAAFVAVTAFGAIPETAEDWYKPEGGFEKQETTGKIYYDYDRRTGWKSFDVTVDAYGEVTLPKNFDLGNDPALTSAYEALTKALRNESYLNVVDESLKTLGENLDAVFNTDGITIEGYDPNGKKVSYKLTFKPGQGIGSDKGTAVDNPSLAYKHTDEKSLRWTEGNKAEIYGWDKKAVSGDFLTTRVKNGVGIPIRRTLGAELEYLNWYGLDNLSLLPNPETKRLELKGWANDPATMTPLAEAMTQEGDIFSDYELVVRNSSKGLNYVNVGKLKVGDGAPVDGESITTNLVEGATGQGIASLRGWADADNGAIPYNFNGVLTWATLSTFCDNKSIGTIDSSMPGALWLEVKGASLQTANSRYFGTPAEGEVSIGWYDLPNVTTNYIEGDEKTLTTVYNEDGVKKLGWKYNPLDVPSVARTTVDGEIEWLPYESLSNITFICDNESISTNENNEIELKGWEKFSHGVIGKAQNGSLVCKTPSGTNGVEHIENESVLAFGLAGFTDGNNCEEKLADLLKSGDKTHKVLARYGDGDANPTLHYLPLGELSAPPLDNATLKTNDTGHASIANFKDAVEGGVLTKRGETVAWEVVKSGVEVDDTTITTNTAHGAVTMGEASIYGWSSAANDTYLSKNEDGNLEWRQIDGGTEVDDSSITKTSAHGAVTNGIASIYGFADAPVGTVPIVANVNGQKVLRWGCPGNFGLTATKNGNEWTYTVSGGYYISARTANYISNSLTVSTSGGVYLKVPMDGSGAVVEHTTSTIPLSTSTITYIPLYWLNTTGFVVDYRGAPQIQVWE